ncbi:hypothetical protein GCM10010844_07160 [Deinococcus radiotolerans]|uniref:Uncharacterized protein n=1 Tax=Deinococcus radiotolerans TaxID=1309407 RepID=A0ABQ2FFY2_9DEIO|nr:hypothetical protein GCM10010844_07160 [Deinococcus radiotolerans]
MLPFPLTGQVGVPRRSGLHPKTQFTTRMSQEALGQAGLTSAGLFEASCSLECTVSNMPNLEE